MQRVKSAQVSVGGQLVGQIDQGILVLLGVGEEDGPEDVRYMVDKIPNLRIFDDADGKMNLSCMDVGGGILAVSQFTLYGDCRRGRRPSFSAAAEPDRANALYEQFVQSLAALGVRVETGVFRAEMEVSLVNHGPVTVMLDSSKSF